MGSIHEGGKFKCYQCGYKAMQRGKDVMFPCDQCYYKATARSTLLSHLKSVHEGVKYPCDQCDYKATARRNLRTHKKIHSSRFKVSLS